MDEEQLVKILKKKWVRSLILGLVFFLLGAALLFIMIVGSEKFDEGVLAIVCAAVGLAAVGVLLIAVGAQYTHGVNSKFVRKREHLLEYLYSLKENPIYEDNYVVISEKAVAGKKNLIEAVCVDDVLMVNEYVYKTNGITSAHTVDLWLRNGKKLQINVYGKKQEVIQNLIAIIHKYCMNSLPGFNKENLDYVRKEQKKYKELHKK